MKAENAHLGSRVAMMVRIKLMLCDLVRPLCTDAPLGHLLTDTGMELTHLRALSDLVAFVVQILCSLHRPTSSRRPNLQWPQFITRVTMCDHILLLGLSVGKQAIGHFPGVIIALFRKARIGLVIDVFRYARLN